MFAFARKPAAVAAALTALALAACGDSTPSDKAAGGDAPAAGTSEAKKVDLAAYKGCALDPRMPPEAWGHAPVLCVELETSGAYTLKRQASGMMLAATCADTAKPVVKYGSSTPQFEINDMLLMPNDKIGFGLLVFRYKGPGTYTGAAIHDDMRSSSHIKVREGEDVLQFTMFDTSGTGLAENAKTVFEVKPDGSGSLTWTGLNARVLSERKVYEVVKLLDAKITWRCIDPVKG